MQEIKSNQEQIPDAGVQIKMHEDEIDIDIAMVKRLLAEQFPHLAERSITVVRSTGTVNAIYRLDNDLYVRLPRVELSAESIECNVRTETPVCFAKSPTFKATGCIYFPPSRF